MKELSSAPIAFSYVRFSTPEQLKGDSLRRQTTGAEEYCAKHGLALDNTLSLHDLGVSGFKGAHRTNDKNALAQFLALAKQGRIPAGSYLIVENLDRLSREDERTALRLWMDILDQRINIVQIHPETVFRHEKSDMFDIMRAIMELSRGHGESAIKSERLGKAWDAKRATISERKLTGKAPFWLHLSEDKKRFIEKPEAVHVVKRVYQLARDGFGSTALSRRLNDEGILSPYGRAWNNVSVLWVLRNRAVLGEYTPHCGRSGTRVPTSAPVSDYYPRIINDDDFYAAQGAIEARKNQRGPRGKGVRNLFTGLVHDARDGTLMHIAEKRKGDFRMISSGAMRGKVGSKYISFSLTVFERAVLSLLAEIDPREVLGKEDGPDDELVLGSELAREEAKIAELEAELVNGNVAALARVLRTREANKRELTDKLAEARQRAATPLSAAWGETQSLLAALDNAPDVEDARTRLRRALQRVVDSIWVLVVTRGRDRLAVVQVWFANGKLRRDYLITCQPAFRDAVGSHPSTWSARSSAELAEPDDLDLRRPENAAKLEKMLTAATPAPNATTKAAPAK